MIYEVDVERIESQLRYLEKCIEVINRSAATRGELVQRFALERALHLAVECMIDVGSVMIDGFIMRDPGGYLDIVDILEDEKVIPPELAGKLKELVQIREKLVRYYDKLEEEALVAGRDTEVYRSFIQHVRKYLHQELGEQILK
ncbi:DUF86 domain-containing protein [Paenactinomyces guangxiensis]|uniref:DUF86 domain-containing protein n=1 Tax=Paenactinomyces guangxiensis TaxID=1490290 RepID=A0A7W2A6S0_9BACL|nr:DUF86 domain-containing protein [Paenactinomyces guangxiensis]MBA4493711.1 DUF86 domain-containing protein [Paenactinomyces guangxiensis]MBH8590998.1 DUF86 domain-containing protein [Paenactinomyces guangxiensis]